MSMTHEEKGIYFAYKSLRDYQIMPEVKQNENDLKQREKRLHKGRYDQVSPDFMRLLARDVWSSPTLIGYETIARCLINEKTSGAGNDTQTSAPKWLHTDLGIALHYTLLEMQEEQSQAAANKFACDPNRFEIAVRGMVRRLNDQKNHKPYKPNAYDNDDGDEKLMTGSRSFVTTAERMTYRYWMPNKTPRELKILVPKHRRQRRIAGYVAAFSTAAALVAGVLAWAVTQPRHTPTTQKQDGGKALRPAGTSHTTPHPQNTPI